jgi:hypothetical protein
MTWSAKRVFIVVALGYAAFFVTTWFAFIRAIPAWDEVSGMRHDLGVVLLRMHRLSVIPTDIAVEVVKAIPGHSLDTAMLDGFFTGAAAGAVVCATLSSVAFVLVRRVRDRRAASKAV